jgi:hypothetical protein
MSRIALHHGSEQAVMPTSSPATVPGFRLPGGAPMPSIPDIDARIAESQARKRALEDEIDALYREIGKRTRSVAIEDDVTDGLLLIRYSATARA